MSRFDAERLARLYEGFYADQDREPPRDPSRTSAFETLAGFAVLAIVIFIFGWVL
jgi:hypothetical protein